MPGLKSVDHASMREMNIALVLDCLRRESLMSRAHLAKMTGLTKTTVSSLVLDLLNANLVREMGIESGEKGRPSILLELNPKAGYIFGVEIGVDFISIILTNFAADVQWRHRESILDLGGQDAVIDRMIDLISEACTAKMIPMDKVLGLGLGVPGMVDEASGTLLFAPNLGWRNVPLRDILKQKFPFPIYVDNEARMAALGETVFGAARGKQYVLYVSASVGLGAGLVVGERLLAGASGMAGEVGHMTIDPDGPRCNCGNHGCWEMYVSQWAVFRRVRNALACGAVSSLAKDASEDQLTIPRVVEAAKSGDGVARSVLEETGRYMGLGLANLINAFNPQRVVLGGMLTPAHEFMLPMIRQVVEERALRWPREAAEIVVSAHGGDSCVMGGVAAVYNPVLIRPLAARA